MKRLMLILALTTSLILIAACANLVPPQPTSGDEPAIPTASAAPTNTALPAPSPAPTETPAAPDLLNLTIVIDGTPITLVDGLNEVEAAPGSASKIITRFFGNEAFGDLNGDGKTDAAFLLTQEMGGSGTFYYVVAALNTNSGYQGTNAVLLGDRIAPQSTRIENGAVIVNFADRNPGEDFSVQPTLGVSKTLTIQGSALVEQGGPVEQAKGSQITNRSWKWVRTQMNDGTVISPAQPGVFTLTLGEDGMVSGATDCNSFFGSYSLQDGLLSFGPFGMTKMFCETSQEMEFLKYLAEVQSYLIIDGQLVLEIKYDSGQLIFE